MVVEDRRTGEQLVPAPVEVARLRLRTLVLAQAEADWQARCSARWQALAPRVQAGDASVLPEVDAWLAEVGDARLEVLGETLHPVCAAQAEAQAMRDRLDLQLRTVVVEEPPWQHAVLRPVSVPAVRIPRLVQEVVARNQVTDDREWFLREGLQVPASLYGWARELPQLQSPAGLPSQLDGSALRRGIPSGSLSIGLYDDARVAVYTTDGALVRAWDLSALRRAPGVVPGDEGFVDQEPTWAQVADGLLVVETRHRTYAASSGGHNGYLTAFDMQTGAMAWRSAPLVANAESFVIEGHFVISGYGFTAEPDYLYTLDLRDGRTLARTRVRSGPDWLLRDERGLHVRCYDTDYRFTVR